MFEGQGHSSKFKVTAFHKSICVFCTLPPPRYISHVTCRTTRIKAPPKFPRLYDVSKIPLIQFFCSFSLQGKI